MAKMLARCIFLAATAYCIVSLFLASFLEEGPRLAFPMISGMKMFPPYADLRWVTAHSQCGIDLQALASGILWGCDPYGRGGGLGYPPMSIELARAINIKGSHTGLLGFSFGLAVIGVLIIMSKRLIRSSTLRDFVCGLLFISFPMQLALERANIDSVLFLLTASLAAMLATESKFALPFQTAVTWALVSIKLYPIAGLMAWAGISTLNQRQSRPAIASIALGAIAGLATVWSWLMNSSGSAAQPIVDGISHGLRFRIFDSSPKLANVLPWTHGTFDGIWLTGPLFLLTLILGLRSPTLARYLDATRTTESIYTQKFLNRFIALTACTWLGCYVLSTSYDYRLIFAMPALIAVLPWLIAESRLSKVRATLSCLLLAGLAITFTLPLFVHPSLLTASTIHSMKILEKISDAITLPATAGIIGALVLRLESKSVSNPI